MNINRLSAILLFCGFAVMLVASVVGPRGIYQEPDLQRRVQIIEDIKTRWNIAQSLIGLSLFLTAAGFGFLAWNLRTGANAWVPGLGAVFFFAGAISGAVFIYRQTTDPLSAYQGAYSGMETLYYWLALGGLLLFGIAFLQAGLPAWLGYVTAGATIVYGIIFLTSGIGFPTPGVVLVLSLVIAIVLWRQ